MPKIDISHILSLQVIAQRPRTAARAEGARKMKPNAHAGRLERRVRLVGSETRPGFYGFCSLPLFFIRQITSLYPPYGSSQECSPYEAKRNTGFQATNIPDFAAKRLHPGYAGSFYPFSAIRGEPLLLLTAFTNSNKTFLINYQFYCHEFLNSYLKSALEYPTKSLFFQDFLEFVKYWLVFQVQICFRISIF